MAFVISIHNDSPIDESNSHTERCLSTLEGRFTVISKAVLCRSSFIFNPRRKHEHLRLLRQNGEHCWLSILGWKWNLRGRFDYDDPYGIAVWIWCHRYDDKKSLPNRWWKSLRTHSSRSPCYGSLLRDEDWTTKWSSRSQRSWSQRQLLRGAWLRPIWKRTH